MNRIIRFLIYNLLCIFLSLTINSNTLLGVRISLAQSVLTPSVQSSLSTDNFYKKIKPEKIHSQTSIEIASILPKKHYLKLTIDDNLSEKILNRYILDLDPRHNYFLEQDINQFDIYRYKIDNALKSGDLRPAFEIFNKYYLRGVQRLIYMVNRVKSGLENIDFTINETIEANRENAPWAPNIKQLHELWRKQLKNEVLNLKLSDKSIKEIEKLLVKRYLNQLNRYHQLNKEDAFGFYMNAVTRTYDPHSQYLSPKLSEEFDLEMSLSLEGIGAVLQSDNEYTKILRIIKGGPADKGKELMPGDRIVGVGQGIKGEIVDVVSLRLDKLVRLIRGPKHTVVRLQIIPVDEDDEHRTKIISITRDTVKLEEQAAQKKVFELKRNNRTYKIGIIDIPTFYRDFNALYAGKADYRSTTRDVRRLLNELTNENVDGIIIDLRENSGGSLQEASGVAGLFIKQGPIVQIQQSGKRIFKIDDSDPEIAYNGPLVVLINRLSASASEIFAGAIQDYNQGILTGSTSFGKGTVQTLFTLKHGQLKLTTAKFYKVSGNSTQHKGVVPDISFPSIYDKDKIGESTLSEALPWDKIKPASYKIKSDLKHLISQLNTMHKNRIPNSPDFAYLSDSIQYLKEIQRENSYSLCETIRRQERKELEKRSLLRENKRRIAKGLKPIKHIDEIKNTEPGAKKHGTDSEEEIGPFLTESGEILLDLVSLQTRNPL